MIPFRFLTGIVAVSLSFLPVIPGYAANATDARPNILWITSEDNGPEIGAYGDDYSVTPNIDELAKNGLRYDRCWSNAPVCAPARTAIITGMYPPGIGGQHMRSEVPLPKSIRLYPEYLREAGYYCTNNSKEDYNLIRRGKVWNDSSRKAHWKNRPEGAPFFAIFNITTSHESQLRKRPHTPVHDPAGVRVPAYHPDTPEVRTDWAQYYDKLTEMDREVGQRLKELQQADLLDDTIIFYYGDHGSGMPRSKRWPYNSGLHVPLIVHIPEKFRDLAPEEYVPGGTSDRLVAFVDLAPTALSIAGLQPPKHMQGVAFMGEHEAPRKDVLFGFRGRMDERYDMVRSVTDGRYIYIRHFMPHRIYGQHVGYMFQTPTTRVWKAKFDAGELTPEQSLFWQEKPTEELYDLKNDPDEVKNLAESAEHSEIKRKLANALSGKMLAIRDLGLLPEPMMLERAKASTPYEYGQSDDYDVSRILRTALVATNRRNGNTSGVKNAMADDDAAVRYWAAVGLSIAGREAVAEAAPMLRELLKDDSPTVAIAAAEALVTHGREQDRQLAFDALVEASDLSKVGTMNALMAVNVVDLAENVPDSVLQAVKSIDRKAGDVPGRYRSYILRVREHLFAE